MKPTATAAKAVVEAAYVWAEALVFEWTHSRRTLDDIP
jgi:hypothetical protein